MNIPLVNSDIHSPSCNDLHSYSKENSPLRSPRGPARNLIPNIQLPKIEKKDLPITSQPPSNEAKNAFKVCVRIRPLNSKEQSSNHSKKKLVVTKAEDNMVISH